MRVGARAALRCAPYRYSPATMTALVCSLSVVVQREQGKPVAEPKPAEASAAARRQSVAVAEKNPAQTSTDTRLSTPTKGAIDPREFQVRASWAGFGRPHKLIIMIRMRGAYGRCADAIARLSSRGGAFL